MAKDKKKSVAAQLSEEEEMDMTSMIDVVFLLIIFFLCVTELSDASREDLELPRARRAAEDEHEHGRLIININKDGEVWVGGKELKPQQLNRQLKMEYRQSFDPEEELPTRAILVRVDAETPWIHVKGVMLQCIQHRLWKLAFATKNLRGPR
jgi:biopolymer transport protein ExbD